MSLRETTAQDNSARRARLSLSCVATGGKLFIFKLYDLFVNKYY